MNPIHHWSPEMAWAIYQLVDQIREEISKTHYESIQYFLWREKQSDDYMEHLEQLSEEERMELGVWLEPQAPDDPIPF
jgi:hypothetical protein